MNQPEMKIVARSYEPTTIPRPRILFINGRFINQLLEYLYENQERLLYWFFFKEQLIAANPPRKL